MKSRLGILHLEDDSRDAALVQDTLAADGIICQVTRVDTRADFIASLELGGCDLILADYSLPSLDGLSALKIAQDRWAHLPFIFVSGTLDEEVAIEALKIGATDYVFKTRLSRIVPAVRRALREVEARAELGRAEAALRQLAAANDGLKNEIAEHRRAEDALRESERESRGIVDSIPGLVAAFTPDGEVEFVNRQVLEYFGKPLEELTRWGSGGTTHPEDLPRVVELFTQSIASGDPFEFELRARRFDGVYRWLQSRGFPLRDTNGHIVRWYNLLIDIDERKRAEEESRRSAAFLAEAQQLSRVGSFSWRLATDEIMWSEQLYRIFGIDRDVRVTFEAIGSRVHPEDVATFKEQIERSRRDGSEVQLEIRLQMPDGTVKYVHVVAHGRDDRDQREYIGAVQDVTQRRLSEAALAKVRSELAYVARATSFGVLTASIAHEVNQPLAGIVTNAGTCLRMLAADPPDVDGARETARRTIRDGNRASDVITRLRALFSKEGFTLESLDLNEATREVIALSLNDLHRHRVMLQSELADDLPIISGDRIQLQQVILNLLRNASDAMVDVHERPRLVLIKTEREDGNRVRLTVRDAGMGLPPQGLDSMFDAFYTTKSGGMGLGLFVSRSIVERHQGRLWAEPNDGPGATFSFSIPFRTA
jgi:PAS domain S-box-containing protein